MPIPQIISIGGGGFTDENEKFALDRFILAQTGKTEPKIAYLGTASGDAPDNIVNFYAAYTQLACRPSYLTFFARTPDLRDWVLGQDAIYVGGGNTRSMLGVWKEWGLDSLLREAWQNGVVLAGVSAGAICWFEQGITDLSAGELRALGCLGFLPGSCCPHYDGEVDRRPSYRRMVGVGEALPGLALDDWTAAHFHGTELHRLVAARPNARAYHLITTPDGFDEQLLQPEFLSS